MSSQQSGEGVTRSSFAEREDLADRLTAAQTEGRLSADELFARLHRITDMSTRAQLAELVADLPGGSEVSRLGANDAMSYAPDADRPETHVRLLGGYRRSGRWTLPYRLKIFAVVGGIKLDLTEATFTSPATSILLVSGLGGVNLKVPRGVRVHAEVFRLIGGRKDSGAPEDFDGRTVHVRSWGLLGGVRVHRV